MYLSRIFLFSLLSLGIVTVCNAQDVQVKPIPKTTVFEKSINKSIQGYFSAMDAKNWDGMIDYIHPKIFPMIPKTNIKASMQKVFVDSMFTTKIHDYKVDKIADPVKFQDTVFTMVNYHLAVDLTLKQKQKDIKSQKLFTDTLLKFYQKKYGEENVTFDDGKHTFSITAFKNFYAAQFPDPNDKWYFLEKKKQMPLEILEKVIPNEVQLQYQ